jgi:glutaredoxin
MKYIIYSRTNPPCPYCEGAKLIASHGSVVYQVIDIGKDIMMEEFRELFPEQRTVPLIFVENDQGERTKIGGYNEFKSYVESQKAVKGLEL